MFDKILVTEILLQIEDASQRITARIHKINTPQEFYESDENRDKLDSICMMLIAIGESLKNIDRVTNGELLPKYPQVDWRGFKGMRDIISHQYFDVNEEAIFTAATSDIPLLIITLNQIILDLKESA